MMLDYYNDRAIKVSVMLIVFCAHRNNFRAFTNHALLQIQKRWRGFYVRKYKHNFYARKRYLELVEKKNAIVREQLQDYQHQAKQELVRHLNDMRAKKVEEEAKKTHFLMSTRTVSICCS